MSWPNNSITYNREKDQREPGFPGASKVDVTDGSEENEQPVAGELIGPDQYPDWYRPALDTNPSCRCPCMLSHL
jgi:hypothetical protein